MGDASDSEQEIPLPPLPTKPQKTLFSFFFTPKKKNSKAIESSMENNTQCRSKNVGSPVKQTKKKRSNFFTKDKSDDDGDSDGDNNTSQKAVGILFISEDNQPIPQKHTVKDFSKNSNQESSDSALEFVACALPTPFPCVNHIQQLSEKKRLLEKHHLLRYHSEEQESGKNVLEQLNGNSLLNYKSLLNLSVMISNLTAKESPPQRLEECLNLLMLEYPDFPVKKVFTQYLVCQKNVITKNLERIRLSRAAVESLWQQNSTLALSDKCLSEANKVPVIDAPAVHIKKEGKDIRSMFRNNKKKRKKTPDIGDEEKGTQCVEQRSEWKSERKNEVRYLNANKPKEESATIECAENDVSCNSNAKPGGISITGLFGKARKRLEERKRKRKDDFNDDNSKEFIDTCDENVSAYDAGTNESELKKRKKNSIEEEDYTKIPEKNLVLKKNGISGHNISSVTCSSASTEEAIIVRKASLEGRDLRDIFSKVDKQKNITNSFQKDRVKKKVERFAVEFKKDQGELTIKDVSTVKTGNKAGVNDTEGVELKQERTRENDCGNPSDIRVLMKQNDEDTFKDQTKQGKLQPDELKMPAAVVPTSPSTAAATKTKRNEVGNDQNAVEVVLNCFIKTDSETKQIPSFNDETIIKNATDGHNDAIDCDKNSSKTNTQRKDVKRIATSCKKSLDEITHPIQTEEMECEMTNSPAQTGHDADKALLTKAEPESTIDSKYLLCKDERVTPCKIKLKRISSPTPCEIVAEDISPRLDEIKRNLKSPGETENKIKTLNQSGKRRIQKEIDIPSKRQRTGVKEDLFPRRRSLRNRDKNHLTDPLLGKQKDKADILLDVTIKQENEYCEKKTNKKGNVEIHTKPNIGTNSQLNTEESSGYCRRSSRTRKPFINYCHTEFEEVTPTKPQTNYKCGKKQKWAKVESPVIPQEKKKLRPASVEEIAVVAPAQEIMFSPKKSKSHIEVILNEDVMNSFLSWTEKYQPSKARFMIGDRVKIKKLFTWLNSWKERHEAIVKKMAVRALKKQKKNYESDSDFESEDDSDDENVLSNTFLLTGPCGCGTTAAVYACAKQMDFKVLELNPSMYRTGKKVYDQVIEAVVSHQVGKGIQKKAVQEDDVKGSQSMTKFFGKGKQEEKKAPVNDADVMSLVLFEQVDVIHEELDRGFWSGLTDLRRLAKRPIILTCNDSNVNKECHIDGHDWVEHVCLQRPSVDQILPMMQVMCLVEQVFVPSDLLRYIINFCERDVRKTMLQLQFWFERGQQPLFQTLKNKNKITFVPRKKPAEKNMENALNRDTAHTTNVQAINVGINNNYSQDIETNGNGMILSVEMNVVFESCDNESNKKQEHEQCHEIGCIMDANEKYDDEENCGDVAIKIPEVSLIPIFQEEVFFDKEEILRKENFYRLKCTHFSFLKNMRGLKTDNSSIGKLSNTSDLISSMDAYVRNGRTNSNTDQHMWTVKEQDSLTDSLTKEKDIDVPYPIGDMCQSMKNTTEECHRYFTEQNGPTLFYIQDRPREKYVNLYKSVEQRLSTSYLIDRKTISLDILPCLHNICESEELKKLTQQRRKNRRFLHYLDSIFMCFDEPVVNELSKTAFPR
ncbi:uncharacterized protein LOC130648372 isoform X2 [Hydractinia symbiolongicarpus]|uniref:uncharacterized protein LOC130648372 isoform X2 n=1 Tax=Hydractinia symbiolongicarpus TaxID=13093 RepID=UPI00254B3AAC|nr:uncharacterized protein LOC130648372 isoform X2 [Hydractinia symbiolongicarpus]